MNFWTRLGVAVALLGIFCIVCAEMMQRDGYYDTHRRPIAGVLCGCGVVSFLIGRALNNKRAKEHKALQAYARENGEEEDDEEMEGPFMLFNLYYWGPLLLAFAMVVLFIPAKTPDVVVVARAPDKPRPKPEPPPRPKTNFVAVEVKHTNQVIFPAVKLQGITRRGIHSSALINGRTYFLNDMLGEAKLISIFENSVVLQQDGQLLSVTLRK
ncbi:MAG TPA: hypothetical protein VMZ27_16150 [Candidatus Saccharimonadales bacterium]|nr:hypothetical protein [Candidatus Saccharimonadales bacterium]